MQQPTGDSSGAGAAQGWTAADMSAFDDAYRLLSAVIAAYSGRIATADSAEQAAALRRARAVHLAERQTLSVRDRERVAQILAECPALLERVRAGEA